MAIVKPRLHVRDRRISASNIASPVFSMEKFRMDVFESVSTLLAVRAFQSTPVPPEMLRRILEAKPDD